MDWGQVGATVGCVTPIVVGVARYMLSSNAKIVEQRFKLLEQSFQLMLSGNNKDMLDLINGKYVRKEGLEDKISIAVLKAQQESDEKSTQRISKLELDFRNLTSSYARNFQP